MSKSLGWMLRPKFTAPVHQLRIGTSADVRTPTTTVPTTNLLESQRVREMLWLHASRFVLLLTSSATSDVPSARPKSPGSAVKTKMSPLIVDCDHEESPKWPHTANQSPMTNTAPAAAINCSRWTRQATHVIVAGYPSQSTSCSPTLYFHHRQTQQQKAEAEKDCGLNSLKRPVVAIGLVLENEVQMGQSCAMGFIAICEIWCTSTSVVTLGVVRPRPGLAGRWAKSISWQQRGVKHPTAVDGQRGI